VWTRLAFASFGIIMPVLSVVISVFMLGSFSGRLGGGQVHFKLAKQNQALGNLALRRERVRYWPWRVCSAQAVQGRVSGCCCTTGQSDSAAYLFLSAMVLGSFDFAHGVCVWGRLCP
jgi:hypothetical protein